MFSANKKQKGFSLIEVLITILLLAFVLMTLISVFIYGFNLLSKTKQTTLATQIAQEEVELIRNMPFDDILTLSPSFSHDSLSLLEGSEGSLAIEEGPGDDIKKLTVRVRWVYRGNNMIKDVVTYITREGINKK